MLYHLGRTAQAMGRTDEARRHLERALEQGGEFAEVEAVRAALEQLR
ncbi:MAG: tetratricopeptide repeat protein [Krumholzibacteria bacterium]|nr:tetratricopeptide repeat protein [Candidatus Krumholzibacteria bacterium]